jgi:hypothetical protein
LNFVRKVSQFVEGDADAIVAYDNRDFRALTGLFWRLAFAVFAVKKVKIRS